MFTDDPQATVHRLGDFDAELRALRNRVDSLAARLTALEAGHAAAAPAPADPAAAAPPAAVAWGWVGQSRLLQRLATICFVLVVALVLRTLTDGGVFARATGVGVGIAYAALLVGWGTLLLQRQRHGRRVLPACGGVLLVAVVVEASQSHRLLPPAAAHALLLLDLVLLAWLGLRHGAGSVLAIPAVAAALGALTLGFPDLDFAATALLLLVLTAIAAQAQKRLQLEWLQWLAFALTVFFWLLWTAKARTALLRPGASAPGLNAAWFLPLLGATVALHTGIAATSTGAFAAFLPPATVLLGLLAASGLAGGAESAAVLAGAFAAVAVAHFAIARALWTRRGRATAVVAFVLGGTAAAMLAATTVVGPVPVVLLWSAGALGLAVLAARLPSVALLLAGWLLQAAALVLALSTGIYRPADAGAAAIAAAAGTAALASLQYTWSRAHPPPVGSLLARFDGGNHASLLLLWLAAGNAFACLRLLAWHGIALLGADAAATFPCLQSAIVNLAAVALLLVGLRRQHRHLLLTALLVAGYGGLRVFGSDLMTASGVPLVLSVFSFGVVAAVGSVVLGRLQAQRSVSA